MRRPTRGIATGLFDPRLHTTDFPPDDASNDGHFAGAAMSVIRRSLAFASGTGDRNIEFWRTPTEGEFIIEGATIALAGNWTQAGSAAAMILSVEIERLPGSGFWLTLARGVMREDKFASTIYSIDTNQSVWGLRDFQWDEDAAFIECPHRAYDGRLIVTADPGTDTFSTGAAGLQEWTHGLAADELVYAATETGILPTGLAASRYYKRGSGTISFQVSATPGGAAVNITTAGTGPFWFVPIEKDVNVSRQGIYVGSLATRFRGAKVRLRARTISGANAWSGTAKASLRLRMVA